eukprot:g4094.t1
MRRHLSNFLNRKKREQLATVTKETSTPTIDHEQPQPPPTPSSSKEENVELDLETIDKLRTKELRAELEKRGLATTGRKLELRKRLETSVTNEIAAKHARTNSLLRESQAPFLVFVKELSSTELKEELVKRGLSTSGSKKEKQFRLATAVSSSPPRPPSLSTAHTFNNTGLVATNQRQRQRRRLRLPNHKLDEGLTTTNLEPDDPKMRKILESNRGFSNYRGHNVSISGWRKVTERRIGIWRRTLPNSANEIRSAQRVLAVEGLVQSSSSNDTSSGLVVEFIVLEKETELKPLWCSCFGGKLISPSAVCSCGGKVSPSDLVQYRFEGSSNSWKLSHLCVDGIENLRAKKISEWRRMLLQYADPKGNVNSIQNIAFRRMLKAGLQLTIFDSYFFPEDSETERAKWEVKSGTEIDDETKKILKIPHGVAELRVWDAGLRQYRSISVYLTGIPVTPPEGSTQRAFKEARAAQRSLWRKIVKWLKKDPNEGVADTSKDHVYTGNSDYERKGAEFDKVKLTLAGGILVIFIVLFVVFLIGRCQKGLDEEEEDDREEKEGTEAGDFELSVPAQSKKAQAPVDPSKRTDFVNR